MGRLLIVLALVAAACGGSVTAAPTEDVDTTSAPTDSSNDAPDFVLALGQGGEFSPSTEAKPIYMVFWAEW